MAFCDVAISTEETAALAQQANRQVDETSNISSGLAVLRSCRPNSHPSIVDAVQLPPEIVIVLTIRCAKSVILCLAIPYRTVGPALTNVLTKRIPKSTEDDLLRRSERELQMESETDAWGGRQEALLGLNVHKCNTLACHEFLFVY